MKENELISRVHSELETRSRGSGRRFEVLSPNDAMWKKSTLHVIPDLVVRDTLRNRYMIFELKHYDHKRPLSLSTVPLARQIKADCEPTQVQVAIVTNSDVSESLKSGLDAEQVPVIQYLSDDQAAENVWTFIEAESSK